MQLGTSSYISDRRQINLFSRVKSLFSADKLPATTKKFVPPIHELPPSLTYPGLISPELPNLLPEVVIGMFKVYAPQWQPIKDNVCKTEKAQVGIQFTDPSAKRKFETKIMPCSIIEFTLRNIVTKKLIKVKVTPVEIYGRTATDFKLEYACEPPGSLNFNFAKSLTSKLALGLLINFLQLKKP